MKLPRNVALQGGSNGADQVLVDRARAVEPRRRWWWGVRTRQAKTGAWCYLCDRWITTWSGRWPATIAAQLEIRQHRAYHVQGRLDAPPAGEDSK